ncbi:HesA/MoeB/ThiF family protein [Pseudoalteromonas peptidolytica]|uniref:Adenylyltransferase and sulfurtransferase n=1 Tax=Pseudoalteromonas peptidolytica F12-50-A1 TaxID=1315280 RepID=A0A8I0MXH5_9GAMM|nr:HesA/MoeB/ThiF family protein [Pseudoalteromonas peptidolytica]MBE0347158.1 adenylyltransferase and sulfurtransferase [Pseudoalteromonas peptidolytica F12-50-A1]NLR13809.1 HesA/MoeB/ThiF family protein [Pseudoalteromonas peptidolytica]GEK11599.1 molybdopterin biosynthesis protein MoeB [Pseudoalteromonas peptidolytica]
MTELSDKERLRYSRHLLLKEVGEQGQLALKQAHVAVVGCGGLGSPALFYLAASGIGKLTFIDHDEVELSNLQRQILYKVNHLGQQKAKAAGKVLASLNNDITLTPINGLLTQENIAELLSEADVILDCSDNFTTRYLLNKYCYQTNKVLIAGAAIATQGQLMCFDFRTKSPCYACIFPTDSQAPTENCGNFGVLSPILGIIGAQQALLAVNVLLGHHQGSYFSYIDALTLVQHQLLLVKEDSCSECS